MTWQDGSWEAEGARKLRDDFHAWIARHEHEIHDGEVCVEERVGLLAYLAHSIGVTVEHLPEFIDDFSTMIADYDTAHSERVEHEHNGHEH